MRLLLPFATLTIAALLAGCSTGSLLDPKAGATRAAAVPVGNDLALPPDLALRAPGATTDEYVPNGSVSSGDSQLAGLDSPDTGIETPVQTRAKTRTVPAVPAEERVDNFTKYGISKTNPDGTPKNPQQLNKELKAAMLLEKRRANPGYGSIFNIGSIFTDG
jgi:hypothetical protein